MSVRPSRKESRPRFPFRWKLTLLLALVSVGPLGFVGIRLIDVNAQAVERSSRQLQIALADDVARTVEDGALEAEAFLGRVGRVLTDASIDPGARERLATSLVETDDRTDVVAVYDAEGALIDVIRERSAADVNVPEHLPETLRTAAQEEHRAVGAVASAGDVPRSPIVVALRPTDRLTGFVATFASLRPLQARVERLSETHLASLDGVVYVVDDQLRLLAHPDAERAHALTSVADEGILAGIDPSALRARAARSVEHERPDGVATIGTVVGLRSRPWAVVVEVPRATAYASLSEMRVLVTSTIAVTIALALLFAFLIARRITAPIARLSAFASDLAARRFDRRVRVETADELAVLGDAMSTAAAELQSSEERILEEAAIRSDLGRYLPGELVEKVVRREQSMELGGRRVPITVLFADVVAFTPLTDKLPPEEVVQLLNELFTVLTEIVFKHEGTVDKFVGDCVMAMWGAPTPVEDHARRAVAAAEDMLAWLETANPGWQSRHGVTIQLAIGINTGEAVVGNVGSEKRMEYTAIGDVVNVAARLEAIARPQQILVTRSTRDAAGDDFDYADAGERTLPGRSTPVRLFEVRA